MPTTQDEKDAGMLEHHRQKILARGVKLTRRATAKYGPKAGEPGGDPSRDVFDYVLNELAGLPRYAQMMLHRVHSQPHLDPSLNWRAEYICKRLEEEALHLGALIDRFRDELLSRGFTLGNQEEI